MIIVMLVMLLLPMLIILGLVLLVRWVLQREDRSRDRALGTLRDRFAQGEIDGTGSRERRRALGSERT